MIIDEPMIIDEKMHIDENVAVEYTIDDFNVRRYQLARRLSSIKRKELKNAEIFYNSHLKNLSWNDSIMDLADARHHRMEQRIVDLYKSLNDRSHHILDFLMTDDLLMMSRRKTLITKLGYSDQELRSAFDFMLKYKFMKMNHWIRPISEILI
jgi:D-alanine-D-alanine ligase-like ATP-grasp enzyme